MYRIRQGDIKNSFDCRYVYMSAGGLSKGRGAMIAGSRSSSSQVACAPWGLAGQYTDEPDKLREAPSSVETRKSELAERKCCQHLPQVAHEGSNIVQDAYAEANLEWPAKNEALPFDKLKMLAYEDRYAVEMKWNR